MRHPYDANRDPPAPVLPIRIGYPGLPPSVFVTALVDTGADLCVVPERIARQLRLPPVGQIMVRGVGGTARRATVYAAEVENDGARQVVEVIGLGQEALAGRNLLNLWTMVLRGPQRVLEILLDK